MLIVTLEEMNNIKGNKMPIGEPSDIFKGEFSNVSVKVLISTFLAPTLGPLSPLVAELFGVVIPTRKKELFENLLKLICSKLLEIPIEEIEQKMNGSDFEDLIDKALDQKILKEKFYSPEFADIFEDVSYQAVRATSNERLEYLASVIEHGIKDEEIEHLQTKRLLSILAELNDIEIIILQSYEMKNWGNENFIQKYPNIFKPSELSPDKFSEHQAIQKNYLDHLINLGLLGTDRKNHRTQTQADTASLKRAVIRSHGKLEKDNGKRKDDRVYPSVIGNQTGFLITRLGVMLLQKIGIKQDEEEWLGTRINSADAIDSARQDLEQKEREIRRELEQEVKKAKATLESEVNNLVRRVGRNF